jgi:hypothetical protein
VRISFLGIIYLLIGVIVAAIDDYFSNLNTIARIFTGIAAVLIWPLLLIGFDVRITR